MSNLNELFKKKKQPSSQLNLRTFSQNHSHTSSSSHASSSSRPSATSRSSSSASRSSLFPRPLLESEDSDLTSSSVDRMNDDGIIILV